jgi:chaperonin cofactor prefoldin
LKSSLAVQCERIDKLEQQLTNMIKVLKERDTVLMTRFETIEDALTDHVKAYGGLEPSVSQLSTQLDECKGTIREIVAAMSDRG